MLLLSNLLIHKMISDYNKIQEPEKDKKTFKGFSD